MDGQNSGWRETPSSNVVHVRSAEFMNSFIYVLIYFTYNTAIVLDNIFKHTLWLFLFELLLESTHVTIIRNTDKAMISFLSCRVSNKCP